MNNYFYSIEMILRAWQYGPFENGEWDDDFQALADENNQ